jgi:hypothetical protein
MKIELPKLPGQKESPTLWPPVLPETSIPTPFGQVSLPEYKIDRPRLPTFNEKNTRAMKQALGIDLSMIPGLIPIVGDILADVVEDLHGAELRKILTPKQYDEYLKQDKVAPSTIAMARTLSKGE